MISNSSGYVKFTEKLATLSQQRATGRLLLTRGDRHWHLYFFLGHLLYATGGKHRVRRWDRALKRYCPELAVDIRQLRAVNVWEYQFLQEGLIQEQLSVPQAQAVVRSIFKEVFFTLASDWNLTSRWFPYAKQPNSQTALNLSLSLQEAQQLLQKVEQTWQQWQGMGLGNMCPDRAPVFVKSSKSKTQFNPETLLSMSTLFDGHKTLWDIALAKKQSVTVVTRMLHHFVEKGILEIREVPDFLSPIEQLRLVAAAVNRPSPAIACIDDSPLIGKTLETILIPEGYRILKIHDPVADLSTLVKEKPALIFVDLVMPESSGYALCSFLRKTTVFRDTPIVILTGYDGVIERIRTKFTGATDFVSKSAVPQQIVEIVRKYVPLD